MWICNQRQHPLRERVAKIHELVSPKGKVVINLQEFTGW